MDRCPLSILVSALGCAIAAELPDDNELALLSCLMVQLGDTLATIAAERAACPTPRRSPSPAQGDCVSESY